MLGLGCVFCLFCSVTVLRCSQLKAAESRLQKVRTDLFSAQGEVAAGMIVVRIPCRRILLAVLITSLSCLLSCPLFPGVLHLEGPGGGHHREEGGAHPPDRAGYRGHLHQRQRRYRSGCLGLTHCLPYYSCKARVSVCPSAGRITIAGPDSSSVQRAREMLELFEDSFELEPKHAQWLNDKFNSGLLG